MQLIVFLFIHSFTWIEVYNTLCQNHAQYCVEWVGSERNNKPLVLCPVFWDIVCDAKFYTLPITNNPASSYKAVELQAKSSLYCIHYD
jgi:hypothetical protein